MKKICILLFLLFYCYSSLGDKAFVLAGQSNMRGRNCWLKDLPSSLTGNQTGVMWFSSNGIWETLCAPTEPLPVSEGYFTDWGPEISLGKTLFSNINETIYLIKHSKGGTTLGYDWNPELSNSLYHSMTARVSSAMSKLPSNINIEGFFWMQGENDSIVSNYACDYFSNLINFVNCVRTDFNEPELPFILGMIHPNNSWKYVDIVRQAQTNIVSALPFVAAYDTAKLSTCGSQVCDNIHYTPESIIHLGEKFADIWNTTIPEPCYLLFIIYQLLFINYLRKNV